MIELLMGTALGGTVVATVATWKHKPKAKGECWDGRTHAWSKWEKGEDAKVEKRYSNGYSVSSLTESSVTRTQQRECEICGFVEKQAVMITNVG